MEFSWNHNTECAEKCQSSISSCPFSDAPSFSKRGSIKDLNSFGGLSFSRMLVEFFVTCIFHHVWENFFQFMVFTFPENALNLCIFIYTQIPHSKLQVEFFENLFPPRRKGWRKLWFTLLKLNQKIWRWPGTLASLFIFCMICNISKCDGFTVLWITSIK